jgi:signal transduction histidine kinase
MPQSRVRAALPCVYLAAGGLMTAGYFRLPSVAAKDAWYDGVGVSAVLAILVGVVLYRPRRRAPWLLVAAGQFMWILGDGVWDYYDIVLHRSVPYPSWPDAFYLAGYPLVAAGLVLFVRHRTPGRDRASVVDAGIITTGLGLLVWTYLAAPYARDVSSTVASRIVSVAYPLVDVLLIAVLVRLVVAPGAREKSQYLLLGFLTSTLISDVIYSFLVLFGTYKTGDLIDSGWLVAYVLVGAAALHPSMARLSVPAAQPPATLGRRRLLLLALASLIPPAVLTIEWARGSPLDIPVFAGCAALLFLLVVLRMSGLVREVESKLELLQARDASLASALGELERAEEERRQLLERTIRAAEDERVQVAAELHDGPIQHLAALGYSLESALALMEEQPSAGGERMVREVQTALSGEIGGLRRLMVTLRPPALDQAGLHAALRDFAEALAEQEGLEASVRVDEVDGLSPDAETALYRVAQEALRNVVWHARARRVSVALGSNERGAEITIEDDGVGFSGEGDGLVRRGHFGIAGMRQRIEMVGGTLEIVSAPGRGTTVRARAPRELRPVPASLEAGGSDTARRERPRERHETGRHRMAAGR